MKKVAILGIDLQNDFTLPTGALFVKGADRDIENITRFIKDNGSRLSYIALTLDSHQPIHIATQCYWKDEAGNPPGLFTVISAQDVEEGKWIPQYNTELALDYLKSLEKEGEVCTIWPPHCIVGGDGWAIDQKLIDTLYNWCIDEDKSYGLFYKGFHQATEHYSIFKAAVTYEDAPDTQLNQALIDKLALYDELLIVGEAADYCVANSLKDLVVNAPFLAGKIVMLTDCMSWINNCNPKAEDIFEIAKAAGVRFMESTEYSFSY